MYIPSAEEARIRFFDAIYRSSLEGANFQKPFDDLDRGTRVLSNETECNQYVAPYGGHHFYKLYAAYTFTRFNLVTKISLVMRSRKLPLPLADQQREFHQRVTKSEFGNADKVFCWH
jgi:hypothetical protein